MVFLSEGRAEVVKLLRATEEALTPKQIAESLGKKPPARMKKSSIIDLIFERILAINARGIARLYAAALSGLDGGEPLLRPATTADFGTAGGPAVVPIGPAWSIGSEVGFYFVIPLGAYGAYFVGKRLRAPWAAVVLAAGWEAHRAQSVIEVQAPRAARSRS